VDNKEHDKILEAANENLLPWANKTVFIKNFASLAVHHVLGQVDFIYVDARHDYCGVSKG
jgi:hypothetical protein